MNKLFSILSLALLFVGCSTYQDVVYLQDINDGETRPLGKVQEITIQPSDILSISVNAAESEKELVQPFNIIPLVAATQAGAVSSTPLYGYVVDPDGCINFPTFGKLHVAGMTRNELINFLSNKLINEGQLTRPIVAVSFLNLKVNVVNVALKTIHQNTVCVIVIIFQTCEQNRANPPKYNCLQLHRDVCKS